MIGLAGMKRVLHETVQTMFKMLWIVGWFGILLGLFSEGWSKSSPDGYFFDSIDIRVDKTFLYEKVLGQDWKISTDETLLFENSPICFLGIYDELVYQRTFSLPDTLSGLTFYLDFPRVDGIFSVSLNGKYIGGHSERNLPVRIRCPVHLLHFDRPNAITVRVDTRLNYRDSFPLLPRFAGIPVLGGGLYRAPVLRAVPPMMSSVQLDSLHRDRLRVRVTFDSLLTVDQSVRFYPRLIRDRDDRQVWRMRRGIPVDSSRTAMFWIDRVNLTPWSPTKPVRYRLAVDVLQGTTLLSSQWITFAYTRQEIRDQVLYLNGEPFRLKGVDWVEGKELKTLEETTWRLQLEQDLDRIKSLGANAIRVKGGIPPEELLNLCDEKGVGVLAELPIRSVPPQLFTSPDLMARCIATLEGMVRAYKHHPSLFAWGLGQGWVAGDSLSDMFLTRLAGTLRELDSQRWRYAELTEHSDTLSCLDRSVLPAPQSGESTLCPDVWYTVMVPRPALSVDSEILFKNQALEIKNRMVPLIENAAGILVGPLRDFKGDSPYLFWGGRGQAHRFRAGLVDSSDTVQLPYEAVSALYHQKPFQGLYPDQLSTGDPFSLQILALGVLAVFLLVLKGDRRFRNYLRRVFWFPHGFYVDLTENRQVNIFLTFFVASLSFLTIGIILASVVFHANRSIFFDYILTWFFPDPESKLRAIWMVWHPEAMVLLVYGVMWFLILFQAAVVRLIVFVQKRPVKLSRLVAFYCWASANLLWLLPVALIVNRVPSESTWVFAISIYVGGIVIWTLLRLFRGLGVVFQFTLLKLFPLYLGGAAVFLLVLYSVLERYRSLSAFVQYLFSHTLF
jgi:hypothetical protein